jgi:hypothetical protein
VTKYNRVVIETGTKKVFASAIDWPGWSRSGKTEDGALAALADYAERYEKVAAIAGERGVRSVASNMAVIEHLEGSATTDFGAPDRQARAEGEPMTIAECERQVRLMQACWTCFDDAAARVSEELQKGPRGGGRNRSKMIAHVFESERSYVRQIGVKTPKGGLESPDGLQAHRDAVCQAIREINAGDAPAPKWPLRYFIRRAAWHVMDHAWEMEDKDLTTV